MLRQIMLFGVILIAFGHIWCTFLAYQTRGYWNWYFFGIWKFIFTDWDKAKQPFLLMLAGLLIVLGSYGLHRLGLGSL